MYLPRNGTQYSYTGLKSSALSSSSNSHRNSYPGIVSQTNLTLAMAPCICTCTRLAVKTMCSRGKGGKGCARCKFPYPSYLCVLGLDNIAGWLTG